MSYYTDLMTEIAALCLSMSLGNAETYVDDIDAQRLTRTEYIHALSQAATRIGGCAKYDPASAFAAASRVTERALANYDPADGDQTLDLMRMLTHYLDYPDASLSGDAGARTLLEVFTLWIDVWSGAEANLDPAWQPQAGFPPFGDPRVVEGQTPEGIEDPALRASYTQYLEDKQRSAAWSRSQAQLRRAMDQFRDAYLAQAARVRHAGGLDAALAALAPRVSDPALKSALAG